MRNDGTEAVELFHSNIFEIASLRGQLKRSQIQSNDAYRQTGDAFVLLKECRDLFEIVMDTQLQQDILELVLRIDEFLPQGETDDLRDI